MVLVGVRNEKDKTARARQLRFEVQRGLVPAETSVQRVWSNSCQAPAEGEGSSATSIVPVSRLCRICFMFCSVDLCNDFELGRSGGTGTAGTRDSSHGEQSL